MCMCSMFSACIYLTHLIFYLIYIYITLSFVLLVRRIILINGTCMIISVKRVSPDALFFCIFIVFKVFIRREMFQYRTAGVDTQLLSVIYVYQFVTPLTKTQQPMQWYNICILCTLKLLVLFKSASVRNVKKSLHLLYLRK